MNFWLVFFIISGITGKIQGTVTDEATGEAIPYVDIVILGTEIGAATDENGNFFILNVPRGTYTVEVSYIGYRTQLIEDVTVEIDQTTRLKASLSEAPIEMEPITVKGKMPPVKKDMIGTTYIIRKEDIMSIPVDYAIDIVAFQAAVARTDTAFHVRGGRATEVNYMIDNVSIVDPQTGDLAISLSKGVVDEVIFVPGGFDTEYGRAMSGIINLISKYPSDRLQTRLYAKTETIMPFYFDFGYQNYQASIHLPVSKRFKGFFSFDLMHTDDWNPKLFILPHKQRDDYSLYGKWVIAPSGKLKINLSGAKSRTQFDRYHTEWQFSLDNYRSDMRRGNLQVLNMSYLPDTRKLFNVTISRLFTRRIYGVREPGEYGLFEDFTFKHYFDLEWPHGSKNNPFGIYISFLPIEGDYYIYQDKSSQVLKGNINTVLQIHKYHELKAGVEYTQQDFDNFTYFLSSDTLDPITDEYRYYPVEYTVFVQDNIDYEGLYAKIGCRYEYFDSDISGIEPKKAFSPRIGFSFMVTENFLFRTNIGKYVQPPLYDYMYSYYSIWPFPPYITGMKNIPPIGNPELKPENTISFEIGIQGEASENLLLTINAFYKTIYDLIGTRIVQDIPVNYVKYFNVEYANVKGLEAVFEFQTPVFTGKISYTRSWAIGTSSYAEEVYYRYYYDQADTIGVPPAEKYYLDFDQRDKLLVQGLVMLPLQVKMNLFGYIGQGFPYTPPGPEGKYRERNILRLPTQIQIDCVLSKVLKIGALSFDVSLEVVNLLDQRHEIAYHMPLIAMESIRKEKFIHWYSIRSSYYHPAADLNHDGLVSPSEEYLATREFAIASDDWVNAYSAPRRARLGITMNF